MNTPPDSLSRLAEALAEPTRCREVVASRPGRGGRQAAVLALIADQGEGPDFVVTERASSLRNHAGQISFPGGAIDPTDRDAEHAALREAHEEVALRPGTVRVLGQLPAAFVSATGFDVNTVVGWWVRPHQLSAVEAEVAAVHRIPVTELAEPANRAMALHQSGYRGPAFVIGDLFIWGLTAHLLSGLLELAGWATPWDRRRTLDIPDRFLRGSSRTHRDTGDAAH